MENFYTSPSFKNVQTSKDTLLWSIATDGTEEFKNAVNEALKKIKDLTPVWISIQKSWYESNKRGIYALKGRGKYKDLSMYRSEKYNYVPYKIRKIQVLGSAYPILRGFDNKTKRVSGRLERSLTIPGAEGGIAKIKPESLILGTEVKNEEGFVYPIALHFGAPEINLPARPVILWGSEQALERDSRDRIEQWVKILNKFMEQKLSGLGRVE